MMMNLKKTEEETNEDDSDFGERIDGYNLNFAAV